MGLGEGSGRTVGCRWDEYGDILIIKGRGVYEKGVFQVMTLIIKCSIIKGGEVLLWKQAAAIMRATYRDLGTYP